MEVGDKIQLAKGPNAVVACQRCGAKMIDIAREDIGIGDLLRIKLNGLRMGDPSTPKVWCIDCEVATPSTRRKIKEYFDDSSASSDTHFWGSIGGSSGGSSSDSGSSSGGGFGGFGGFGGGGFSGGGASGGF